jgi:hypothetical protein
VLEDSVENFIWQLERILAHPGLHDRLYAETFQESGGAWSSTAFQLNLPGGELSEVAHHREPLFSRWTAMDSLVFQRGSSLVGAVGNHRSGRMRINPRWKW